MSHFQAWYFCRTNTSASNKVGKLQEIGAARNSHLIVVRHSDYNQMTLCCERISDREICVRLFSWKTRRWLKTAQISPVTKLEIGHIQHQQHQQRGGNKLSFWIQFAGKQDSLFLVRIFGESQGEIQVRGLLTFKRRSVILLNGGLFGSTDFGYLPHVSKFVFCPYIGRVLTIDERMKEHTLHKYNSSTFGAHYIEYDLQSQTVFLWDRFQFSLWVLELNENAQKVLSSKKFTFKTFLKQFNKNKRTILPETFYFFQLVPSENLILFIQLMNNGGTNAVEECEGTLLFVGIQNEKKPFIIHILPNVMYQTLCYNSERKLLTYTQKDNRSVVKCMPLEGIQDTRSKKPQSQDLAPVPTSFIETQSSFQLSLHKKMFFISTGIPNCYFDA